MTHETNLPPVACEPLANGAQTALVALNTPPLRIGDNLTVRELLPHRNQFTDRTASFRITHLYAGAGILPGFTLASLAPLLAIEKSARDIEAAIARQADTKPEGWMVAGEVLEVTPAAITVQDQHGERHVLTGIAWSPEAQPTDSVILSMTPEGFRLRVFNRQCPAPAHSLDPSTGRCAYCRLLGDAIAALNDPVPF